MEPNDLPPHRLALYALLATTLFIGALVWLASALLLLVAATPGGRFTAIGFLLAIPALAGAPFAWSQRRREPSLAILGVLLALGCLAFGHAINIAPDVETGHDAPLRAVYLEDSEHPRAALANIVPEVDQFTFGSYVMGPIDPFMDREQTQRVRALFQRVYGELAEDPAFAGMGSAMPHSYRELFGGPSDVGHMYVYTPAHEPGEQLPVLLFLHGWGGPFQGYLWVFRHLADAHGYAVVAPSFGMGWWRQAEAMDAVERTLAWIEAQPELDGDHVVLSGLSNGGPGVGRAAMAFPERWRGVAYISAAMDAHRLLGLGDSLADHGTPVLVVTADAERRIPLQGTLNAVELLRSQGVQVELEVYPGEDHFLLFSQPEAVMERLGAWLELNASAASPDRPS